MAKRRSRRGVNVSAAIREYLEANPNSGPTAAAQAISEQVGKKVTPTYVSNIKGLLKGKPAKKGRRGRRPGRPAGTRVSTNGSVDLATVEAVKKLLSQLGADTAKRLIDVLA